ncbi:MAG: dihydropteroate synthase [Candidatus Methanoplasma sp.]|jgi:dihydropteroate synthase|nr:dihydropteroate synthase [Candidatus Methanoplasma sp.]
MIRRDWHRPVNGSPFIMGVLNVTPDSFSDGGRFFLKDDAVRHAFELVDQGADIIDIGGESTRPGSVPISAEEEKKRIIPVIREIASSTDVPISVDTMKAEVMEAALDAGARIINDICGLTDPKMMALAVSSSVPVVIMHMHGAVDKFANNLMEGDALLTIRNFLYGMAETAVDAGVDRRNIILDPGVGFGKTPEQNIQIIRNSSYFGAEYPVLIGPSRKRFLSYGFPGLEKDEATAEASRISADSGADIIRVHNVPLIRKALEN